MHTRLLLLLSLPLLLAMAVLAAPVTFAAPYDTEPAAGTEIVCPTDGSLMVWVPSGYFIMGMDKDEADVAVKALGYKGWEEVWAWEWFPRRNVYVPGYFIDKYEVTVGIWRKFCAEMPGFKPKFALPVEKTPGEYALYPTVRS